MYSLIFNCFVNVSFAIAAIFTIAERAAIATIFSFDATFHQFTYIFCIRQIIAEN